MTDEQKLYWYRRGRSDGLGIAFVALLTLGLAIALFVRFAM